MTNGAALIKESIWRDKDFRKLPRVAQCAYCQLLSQKDLDCAGLLTLHIQFLAKGCDEMTAESLREDLETLESNRFVFFDEDTDELFIRAYMRTAQVVRSPNVFKSALKAAAMVTSPKLRVEVAAELRRLHRKEADAVADELNPPKPFPNPSETLPNGVTLSEPPRLGTGTGLVSPSVVDLVGEEPPRFCPKHSNGTDGNCWACGQRRVAHQQWTADIEAAAEAIQSAITQRRKESLLACPDCDEYGWRLDAGDTAVKCEHRQVSNA